MKRLCYFVISVLTLLACDDGDIIVTSFDFDEIDLELCRGSFKDEYVFYKINDDTFESVSLDFVSEVFSDTIVTETPIIIDLEDNANFIYRRYTSEITSDYFCGTIPSNDIVVDEELVGIAGDAEISVIITVEDDGDGVDAEDEDLNGNGDLEDDDTDGDGIPNYIDQDDDDDNIPTSAELTSDIVDDENLRDSDEDGIPDYLDNDDDNDGILTRNEDANGDGTPRNDRETESGELFYLEPNESPNPAVEVEIFGLNEVETTFRTIVGVNNLVLDGENDSFEDDSFSFEYIDVTITKINEKE